MRFRLALAILCGAGLFSVTGCDFGDADSNNTGSPGPGPGPGPIGECLEFPFVESVSGLDQEVCAGSTITIIGKNFSSDLSENRVVFRGQSGTRIAGIPIQVVFPTDNNCANGLESQLQVMVPGGVVSGTLEVEVNGIPTGGFGFTACPQIMAFQLGRAGDLEALEHLGVLGFEQMNSFIILWGINFNNIENVVLRDEQRQEARVPANLIQRNPAGPGGPTGYTNIGIDLAAANVRLAIRGPRDNVKVFFEAQGAAVSNEMEVPVVRIDQNPQPLGAVVNGLKIPTGIRSGAVRLQYSLYDQVSDASWGMDIGWRVFQRGSSQPQVQQWFTAAPDTSDPENDGTEGILCGTLVHPSGHTLFPGGGAIRTFTWNPLLDDNFRQLIATSGARRLFPIEFRIAPVPQNGGRPLVPHEAITPPIMYLDLADSAGEDLSAERMAEVFETFDNRTLYDDQATRAYGQGTVPANWAQPTGILGGAFPPDPPQPFGEGTADVVLEQLPGLPPDVIQFFELNTDTVNVRYIQVFLNVVANPNDDLTVSNLLDISNPGRGIGEFHFRTLVIKQGTLVRGAGARPLIIRLSGTGDDDAPETVVFAMEPETQLNLSGANGQDAPLDQPGPMLDANLLGRPGAGGAGGTGGGAGGRGGTVTLQTPQTPNVNTVTPAVAGAGGGGGGAGETTGAVNFRLSAGATTSQFSGGPGGGGGHRKAGGRGDPGQPEPQEYHPPHGGAGGAPGGDPNMLSQLPGSGGGGGGATVSARPAAGGGGTEYAAIGGAGGGGGGGALNIVANGSMMIDGVVRSTGGNGGNARVRITRLDNGAQLPTQHGPPGAGGGGSGGSLLLQAMGRVDVGCDQLSVAGGLHGAVLNAQGAAGGQNAIAGSGDGSPGWIRIESNIGGAPTCAALAAESALAAALTATERQTMRLVDASAFPDAGTVLVTATVNDPGGGMSAVTEEIRYASVDRAANALLGLARGQNGTMAAAHAAQEPVVLRGAVVPLESGIFSEGQIAASPDPLTSLTGREGNLHLFFSPSVDPRTGEPITDPVTGEPLSIYEMDTDTGVILDANGRTIRSPPRQSTVPPNILDLLQLQIDTRTILRARGSQPLGIFVVAVAEISGSIDVSGAAGGLLEFDQDDPANPGPGEGGKEGAGGGGGGIGGTIEFQNGNSADKDPANTLPLAGGPGGLPAGARPEWDQTPAPFGNGNPEGDVVVFPGVTRALPGATLRGQNCGTPQNPIGCANTAGGGGGGGNLREGEDGAGLPDPAAVGGARGSAFGVANFRFEGLWLLGATGGAGGGGAANVSSDYREGRAGNSLFQGEAAYAPGTGGGGAGGVLHLRAGILVLASSAKLLARGGDAYQSIDLGGNGGAGGGGNIIIQVRESMTVAAGATFDVTGGIANLPVPVPAGQTLPLYEGNIRTIAGQTQVFGGLGGNGSPGRLRIEAERGSLALETAPNDSLTAGPFLSETAPSVALSRTIRLGVSDSQVAAGHDFTLGDAAVRFSRFGQPVGTDSAVLWSGARESLDRHGEAATLTPGFHDPKGLLDREFIRFTALLRSNVLAQEAPSINSIELPYTLELPPVPGS